MRKAIVSITIVCCLSACSVGLAFAEDRSNFFDRAVIRQRFHESIDSASAVNALVEELNEIKSRNAEGMPDHVFVYYAALRGLQAKYGKNLVKKLEDLKSSLNMLDEAVVRAPDDLEVRFVRFSSLHHFPNLLGIGKKRGRDLQAIVTELKKRDDSVVDQETQKEMIRFLLESDRLSREQTSDLKSVLRSDQ